MSAPRIISASLPSFCQKSSILHSFFETWCSHISYRLFDFQWQCGLTEYHYRVYLSDISRSYWIAEVYWTKSWAGDRWSGTLLICNIMSTVLCKYIHSVSKNDTDVAHYNFDADQPMLIIFGREFAETVCYQTVICYPLSPNYCLCTTWRNMNLGNCLFSVMLYTVSRKRKWIGKK